MILYLSFMLETIFKWIALAGKLAIAFYLCPDFPTFFGQSLHSSRMDPLTNMRQIRSTQISLTTCNHTVNPISLPWCTWPSLLCPLATSFSTFSPWLTTHHLHCNLAVPLVWSFWGVFEIAIHSALNARLIGFHKARSSQGSLLRSFKCHLPETVPEHLSGQSNFCHSLDLDSVLFIFMALHAWPYARYLFVYSLWPL